MAEHDDLIDCSDLSKLHEWSQATLDRITTAYLGNCNLQVLPDTIMKLTKLEQLILNNNQLATLPDFIGNLINLRYIMLNINQLTTLPDSIGNLRNLNNFFLYNNQLTTLPDSIGNLIKLDLLSLTNNQLTSLPDSIGNLRNLKILELSNNQLTSLPDSIGNLTNLRKLHLRNNKLTSLPNAIGNLTNLQQLDLRENPQLLNLPNTISNLRSTTIQRSPIPQNNPINNQQSDNPIQLENSNQTIDPMQMGMDMIEGNVRILDFLKESPTNLVIKSVGQENYILTSHENIQTVLTTATFYKCHEATGFPRLENIDKTRPLFSLNAIGLNVGFGYLQEIKSLLASTHQYFALKKSEEEIIAVVSKNVLENGGSWVSANHCQPLVAGSVKQPVHHLVLANPLSQQSGGTPALVSLVDRDKTLAVIQATIKQKKQLLIQKSRRLKERLEENEYLRGVAQDYQDFHDIIMHQHKEQLSTLHRLNDSMKELMRTNRMADEQLAKAKEDQAHILAEIEKIKSHF